MLISRVMLPGASLVCSVREHQVAGQGGLHGDAGGLLVADLADHDDVGVLPQQAAQGRGEGHADLLVHLDLVDDGQVVLDRVLDGGDVQLVAVHDAAGPSTAWWSCRCRSGR